MDWVLCLNKAFGLLIIACVIIFGYYALQGDRFIDGDSYFYLAQYDFDPVLLKTIYCGLLIACLFVVAKIGELFDKEKGYLLAFIMFGFTFFVSEFWKLENDAFGYLFGLLGLYLTLHFWLKKDKKSFILSLVCFGIGYWFWQGVLGWFLVGMVFNLWYFVVLIPIFFVGQETIIKHLSNTNNPNIVEGLPFIAIIYFGLTIFFLFGVLKTKWKIVLAAIILCVPALIAAKFYVLPLIFLCLIAFNGIKMLQKDVTPFLVLFCLLMTCFWIISLDKQFPTQEELQIIKDNARVEGLQNSFGVGWILKYYGGSPTSISGYGGGEGRDYNLVGRVLIEASDLNKCVVIKQTSHLILAECPT